MNATGLIILLIAGWGRTLWQTATLYAQTSKIVTASDASVSDSVHVGAAWSWAISSALGAIYSASIKAWPILFANLVSMALQVWVLARLYRPGNQMIQEAQGQTMRGHLTNSRSRR